MLHIFHHNDADGYAAGYLVKKFFTEEKNYKDNEYKFHEMNYNKDFPLNQIKKDDIVFIVDFSIEPELMIKLLKITKNVVWIDHHISAIDKYNDWYNLIKESSELEIIEGLRLNGVSGCALTYLYLYQGINQVEVDTRLNQEGEEPLNLIEEYTELLNYNAPNYLISINDWDVWRLKYIHTKPFITALSCKLDMNLIEALDKDEQDDVFHSLISTGMDYLEYRDNWTKQLRKGYGYVDYIYLPYAEHKSYSMYCLNVGNANSDFSGIEMLDKYDIVCQYCFNGTKYIYSLYSNKEYVDCAEIAKYFGVDNGGGHKGAAGFRHKDLLFKKP